MSILNDLMNITTFGDYVEILTKLPLFLLAFFITEIIYHALFK